MPVVSVIIPCLNGADHICTAVESVLTQTLGDLEVIVVDDGSTDSTALVLKQFLVDRRVHYLYQRNRGLPSARNTGARASCSNYLAFLDADDKLAPNAVEVMLREVVREKTAWCLIDILKKTSAGDEVQSTTIPAGNLYHGILSDDFVRRGMFFLKESFFAVGMFDEEMKNREDWDLNIRMFAQGLPFSYVPKPLYHYTSRPGSITGDRTKILNYTEKLLNKHHKRLADSGDRVVSKIYAKLLWCLARERIYQTSDLGGALRCVSRSLQYDLNPKVLLHPFGHQMRRLLLHVRHAMRA